MGREGMGWGTWLGIVVAVVIVVGVVGLGVYGGRVHPPTWHIEQVVPDDHLPH
jgi:hypothetical protein